MSKKKKTKRVQTAKPNANSTQKKSMLIYYVAVIGFAFAYHIISNQEWFLSMAKPIFTGYAQIGSTLLNVLGEDSVANGNQITSPFFSMTIKEGCDAITPIILYTMAIIAFPIALRLKMPGVAIGIVALFVLNVIRIISLYYVGKHFSYEVFDFMHVDIWQILFLVATIFLWLIWMRWALVSKSSKVESI